MNAEKFSECCLAKVCRDGNNITLTVCCILKDPETGKKVVHRKKMDLKPIIAYVDDMLKRYHAKMHQESAVSGEDAEWMATLSGVKWDSLVEQSEEIAKRMGEARLVKALYSEISPMLRSNEVADDGAESDMHQKAHAVLIKAREGDRNALGIMAGLMNSAYRGNTRALEIMMLMRDMNLALDGKEAATISGVGCAGMSTPELIEVGSFWNKFKKVAKVATAPVWAPAYLATKAISKVPVLRHANKLNPAAWAINRIAPSKPRPMPSRRPPQAMFGPSAPPPPAAPPQTEESYYQPEYEGGGDYEYEPGYGEGGEYGESEFAGPQAEVSGWLYNKGYRTVAETVTSKFPGLGITMRELYKRGQDSDRALALVPIAENQGIETPAPETSPAETPAETPEAVSSGEYLVGYDGQIVGLSWKGLMNKAKSVAKSVTKVANNPVFKRVMPIVVNTVPGGGMALAAAKTAADIVAKAKEGHREAIKEIAAVRTMAEEGNKQALEAAKVMMNMSNKMDEKAVSAPPPPPAPTVMARTAPVLMVRRPSTIYASHTTPFFRTSEGISFYRRGLGRGWLNKYLRRANQPAVAGWFYNVPYRSALEAPGLGVALREMYNRGEGRQPTELMDIVRQMFPTRS